MPERPVVHHLFDSSQGYAPVNDLIAVGDPAVGLVDGRWVMRLGAGLGEAEGVDLVTASLPAGAPLSADADWQLDLEPDGRARRLVAAPPRPGSFDEWRHTPCVVVGATPDHPGSVERLYYTGSAGGEDFAERSMAIGVMTRVDGTWQPLPHPVVIGDEHRPCVLEPKAVHADGHWHLWYQATHHEAAPGERPDTEIRYTRSPDGLTGWSEPVTVATDDLFDVAPTVLPDGRLHLLLARAPNMHGPVDDLPDQGLWSLVVDRLSAATPLDTRSAVRLLDADAGDRWYRRGVYGPCAVVAPGAEGTDVLHIFFTGMAEPEPFRMSVGRLAVPLRDLG